MKKKPLIIILIVVIAIVPSIVAIIAYNNAINNPVTKGSISSVQLSTPSGENYIYNKNDAATDEELFSLLFDMNENAKEVDSLPTSTFVEYNAVYMSYNKNNAYKYYFSEDPDCVYYKDSNGRLYKVNNDTASKFLATKYAQEVFPQSIQPVMKVGDVDGILPENINWAYLSHDGEFLIGVPNVSDKKEKIDVSGGLQISFDKQPGIVTVVIKNEITTVYDGTLEDIPAELFSDNVVYDVEVNAKWYHTSDCTFYGEATYKYIANVLSPAVFYISENSCTMGDFIIVSAKNIVDVSGIKFVSEPALYGADENTVFNPVFFEYGGYCHAFIPFSIYNESKNGSSGDYKFVLSYGGVYQDFTVSVAERKKSPAYLNTSSEKINTYFTAATRKAFKDTTAPILNTVCNDIYWVGDNMLIQPVAGSKVKYGFGLKMILNNANNQSYWHEGVNFTVSAGDEAIACLPGQVCYVGEITVSGTTVIVKHGGGLKSLYAHLSSTSVKVGDTVDKGDILGIVGSTGFTAGRTLHFGLYVFDVPVRYYNYEESGILFYSEISKALGLIDDPIDVDDVTEEE